MLLCKIASLSLITYIIPSAHTCTLTDIPVSCDLAVSGNCTLTTVSTLWHIFNSLALLAWPLWVTTGNRVHTSCWNMCQLLKYVTEKGVQHLLVLVTYVQPVTVTVTVTQMVTTCCPCQVDLALSQSTVYVHRQLQCPHLYITSLNTQPTVARDKVTVTQ